MISREPLGEWLRREVVPRLSLEEVFGGEVRWRRAGAWRARACPLHGGRNPNFHVHPETLDWRCHSKCGEGGDVIDFIRTARGLSFIDAAALLARLAGMQLPREAPRFGRRVAPWPPSARAATPTKRSVPGARTLRRPPAAQVVRLWEQARLITDDPEASAYLAGRGIDPVRIEERDLARVLPVAVELPAWAKHWRADTQGYRLVLPLYGSTGILEALRARLLRPPQGKREPKALAPRGVSVGGLIMADALGRAMLMGARLDDGVTPADLLRCGGLWISEGEVDFLSLSTAWSDADEEAPGVLGIFSGAWTSDLAARVPDGVTVTLATDADAAGEKYASQVVHALAARMRTGTIKVERWRGEG